MLENGFIEYFEKQDSSNPDKGIGIKGNINLYGDDRFLFYFAHLTLSEFMK